MNATKADKVDKAWRSVCPIARTLELVGDKWSLLLVRDMRFGKRTYGELLDSPEGIPTNILADRLKRLEEAGLAVRSEYQDRPVRYAYTLTEKGQDLGNVLLALKRWGEANIPGSRALRQPAAPSRRKVSVSKAK